MRTNVKKENREMHADDNNDCTDCSKAHSRKAASLQKKLVVVVKFLLFMEDDPKHKIIDNILPLALFLGIIVGVAAFMLLFAFLYYGVIGFLMTYVFAVAILPLEILHCIYDR
jgi:hypothetical protein